ncbi:hypothetical protein [Nocardia sp. NPDC004722]
MITGILLAVLLAALVALTWRTVSSATTRKSHQLNHEADAAGTPHTWVWSWIR